MSEAMDAMNKLAKWRSVLAGRQLGTRSDDDQQCKAVKSAEEARLILRAETTALVRLLIEKGVFSLAEWEATLVEEAGELEKMLEGQFRGFRASADGMEIDLAEIQKHKTMEGWPP